MDSLISIESARLLYADGNAAHDFDHVLRVLNLAERIGPVEGADMLVLRAACVLHDCARAAAERTGDCHAALGAEKARRLLSGQANEVVEAITHAIAAHRFRGSVRPATLEAKVLSDCDKLDAIGACGIARAYAIAGYEGQRLWAPVLHDAEMIRGGDTAAHTPVHEYHYKLSTLIDRLYTDSAKKIAGGRHSFMQAFFRQLDREVAGEG